MAFILHVFSSSKYVSYGLQNTISYLKHGHGRIERILDIRINASKCQANIEYMRTLVGRCHNANILFDFLIES